MDFPARYDPDHRAGARDSHQFWYILCHLREYTSPQWNITNARREFGYQPEDDAETFVLDIFQPENSSEKRGCVVT